MHKIYFMLECMLTKLQKGHLFSEAQNYKDFNPS